MNDFAASGAASEDSPPLREKTLFIRTISSFLFCFPLPFPLLCLPGWTKLALSLIYIIGSLSSLFISSFSPPPHSSVLSLQLPIIFKRLSCSDLCVPPPPLPCSDVSLVGIHPFCLLDDTPFHFTIIREGTCSAHFPLPPPPPLNPLAFFFSLRNPLFIRFEGSYLTRFPFLSSSVSSFFTSSGKSSKPAPWRDLSEKNSSK